MVVYRPPPSKENCLKTSEYLNDFDDFLTFINSFGSKILMLGDFNIHVDTPNKWDAKRFLMSIETAGLYQHIHEPTHKDGHTLDLVLTRPEDNLVKCTSVGPRPSDHHFTHCTLDLYKPTKEKEIRTTRNFKKLNRSSFHSDLSKTFDFAILSTDDTDSLAILYNETIETCLNTHPPMVTKTCSSRKRQPWYNDDIHVARRKRRKLEKKWRNTRLEVDHQLYIEQNKLVNFMIDDSKKNHFKTKLDNADSKTVFKIVNTLLNKDNKTLPEHSSVKELSNDFALFFTEKVEKIHSSLKDEQSSVAHDSTDYDHSVTCYLSKFEKLSENDVLNLVNKCNTKSCLLDPLPTWYLKENMDIFVHVLTHLLNMSLSTGVFPNVLKQALINPIIKKQTLDPNELKNYRPVANIPFLSKLLEKHVFNCINEHMKKHNFGEDLQSAYRSAHSTETALLHVKDYIMTSLHKQQGVFVVLLDLSAAFDTVEHSVLVKRMANETGLTGTALKWYLSYVTGRMTRVCIDGVFSEPCIMHYGLPQGSIVGPGSFKIYTLPIGRIIRKHNISYHMYADDIQLQSF